MLASLCERPDEKVGLAAVGFLCAGLGAAAFEQAPDAMKVKIAEGARALKRPASREPGAGAAKR
jgi:hypothetical protein